MNNAFLICCLLASLATGCAQHFVDDDTHYIEQRHTKEANDLRLLRIQNNQF